MPAGSAGELKRKTVMSDGQTHRRSEFIYKIIVDFVEVFLKVPMTKMWHVNLKIKKPLAQV